MPILTTLKQLALRKKQQVSSATGVVTRWVVAGTEILAEPIVPCFYRAPTDNDRGGSGGNSHANRCGFGSENRGSNFRVSGSSVCFSLKAKAAEGQSPVCVALPLLPPLTCNTLNHLHIAFKPSQFEQVEGSRPRPHGRGA